MRIRIGTRGSKLALIQAEEVKSAILASHLGMTPEQLVIMPISTSGDKNPTQNLYDIGGKGLFIKELEEALLANTIDMAVHSMKDVPGYIPEELFFNCILKREDPRDAFLSNVCDSIESLPKGATVGTCSPRRAVQTLALRPDVKIVMMRGNVDTRLSKLESGGVDATILAVAGLKRLQVDICKYRIIDENILLPAVAQGAIGVEVRRNNIKMLELLGTINHQVSYQTVVAERGFLEGLEASCKTPVAAYSKVLDDHLYLKCLLAESDGNKIVTLEKFGLLAKGHSLGLEAAEELKDKLYS